MLQDYKAEVSNMIEEVKEMGFLFDIESVKREIEEIDKRCLILLLERYKKVTGIS